MAVKATPDHQAHKAAAHAAARSAPVQAKQVQAGLSDRALAGHGPASPTAILALQRAAGNRTVASVLSTSLQRAPGEQQGHALVGAAAETPGKSYNQYGGLILSLLEKDQARKQSIQEIVREAAESTSIGQASPNTAEAGKPGRNSAKGQKLAYVLSNRTYKKPLAELPESDRDGDGMQAALEARGYKTERGKNLRAAQMTAAFTKFVAGAKPGDDVVIFYTGHGEVEGLQGVDGKVVAPTAVSGWVNQALKQGFELTVILEACHTGSTTDFVRRQESTRLQKMGAAGGKSKAADLAQVASQLQEIKDRLAKLERAKQALMEEPLVNDLIKKGTLERESKKHEKIIKAAWDKALPEIKQLADKVKGLAGESLKVPAFSGESEWLNTRQLDELDTMTNTTLDLARKAL